MEKSQYSLDITTDTCPLTMVKTKLLIEKMETGELANIRLNAGEPLDNVPRTLRDQGHEVLEIEKEDEQSDAYLMIVRKGPARF